MSPGSAGAFAVHHARREPVIQGAPMEHEQAALTEIVQTLAAERGCHAIVLYGSRARGDFGPSSDWDVAGIRETGDAHRVARAFHGSWLDAFVYPESHFQKLEPDSLRFLGGRIVLDER